MGYYIAHLKSCRLGKAALYKAVNIQAVCAKGSLIYLRRHYTQTRTHNVAAHYSLVCGGHSRINGNCKAKALCADGAAAVIHAGNKALKRYQAYNLASVVYKRAAAVAGVYRNVRLYELLAGIIK